MSNITHMLFISRMYFYDQKSLTQKHPVMMKCKEIPIMEPYLAPEACLVLFETGCALCETSAEGEEIEPGTSDPWGNF